jgi:hypothetical protein
VKLNGFIGPSYTLQSPDIECQRTLNLYPQIDESGVGKNVAALLSTPGLVVKWNLAATPRALFCTANAGRLFAVVNTKLVEMFANGTTVDRGTILSSGVGRVGIMDNNANLLMLVDGPNGYQYDLGTNVLTVVADFPGGETVAYQDSYFIFNVPNTQTFYITGQNTTTVDPLDFSSAEGAPDILLNVISDHRNLWLFGSRSIEVWFDSGAELFPFARIEGAFIPHGLAAQYSPVKAENTLCWLGRDDQGKDVFWRASGYTPQRISTHAVEQAIQRYGKTSDCTGFSYQQDGHSFAVWNFPTGNATWVYDFATNLWHERAYTGDFALERGRPELYAFAFDQHVVSDYASGKVYAMTPTALDDDGRVITKIRSAPYLSDELKNLFVSQVTIDIQTGTAAADQPEPTCMLQWSDDGGQTWSNEHWRGLGLTGQARKRVIWRRLGHTRQRIFRWTMTDRIPVALVDAFIEVVEGAS